MLRPSFWIIKKKIYLQSCAGADYFEICFVGNEKIQSAFDREVKKDRGQCPRRLSTDKKDACQEWI